MKRALLVVFLTLLSLGAGAGARYYLEGHGWSAGEFSTSPETGLETAPPDTSPVFSPPLPHLIRTSDNQSPNDTGTVILPPSGTSWVPLVHRAAAQDAPRRVISYLDRDLDTGVNQLYLYVLGTGGKVQLTKGDVSIGQAQILDSPLSMVVYTTDQPAPSLHTLSLADLADRSFPVNDQRETYFGVSSARSLLANFRGALESTALVLRNLFSPDLEVVREYTNPVADPNRGRAVVSNFLVWNASGKGIYLVKPVGNMGWMIVEFDLDTEAVRDVVVYSDEFIQREVGSDITLQTLALPFGDHRLFYTTAQRSDGTKLDYTFTLHEVDAASGSTLAEINGIAEPLLSPDGNKIYFTAGQAGNFSVYDRTTGQSTTLFTREEFLRMSETSKGFSVIGFGTTENELIFKGVPGAVTNGAYVEAFYSYDVATGAFLKLFTANVVPFIGFRG
ncbi:MAG: hypothetical protein Q8P88_00570 [Candidatus Jorgensenbacteria bacterium]|nr:hypothetical protein [Candidatus Jorgensenbacteria bacterium]